MSTESLYNLNTYVIQSMLMLKDHTSGLSELNFDHTHQKKAIFMKQFTWKLMCKNFKKKPWKSRAPAIGYICFLLMFSATLRNTWLLSTALRGSPQHPAALLRTSFLGALVCRGEPQIKPSVAERRGKQRWCCGKQRWCCSKKYWCSWSNAGAREITHFAILTNFWVRG